MLYYYNGEYSSTAPLLDCDDRGYRYGDGLFETIPFYNNNLYRLDEYYDRMVKNLTKLAINPPKRLNFRQICSKLGTDCNFKDGFIRVQITRQGKGRGYLPKTSDYNMLAQVYEKKHKNLKNYRLFLSQFSTNCPKTGFIASKTSSSLNYVLASQEADNKKCHEAILTDINSNLAECSSSNIFWVKNKRIYTPKTSTNIIPGIIRKQILKLFDVSQVIEKPSILQEADEVFVTNSNILVQSVSQITISGKKYKYNQSSITGKVAKEIAKDIKNICSE